MKEKTKAFYRKVIEYQVFYGWSVAKAVQAAKEEMPEMADKVTSSRAHQRLREYEQQLYRNQLFEAIQKSKELIKYHVQNGGK